MNGRRFTLVALLGILLTAGQASVRAQCEIDKIAASTGVDGDRFGTSVAIGGDYAVVGDPNHGNTGAAYIFKRDGLDWVELGVLAPTGVTLATGAKYGQAVAIDGNLAVIGAPVQNVDPDGELPLPAIAAGAAYVFRRNGAGTWVYETELSAGLNFLSGNQIGYAVAVSGDRIAVGAPGTDDTAPNSGVVITFQYENNTWMITDLSVSANDAAENDEFGRAVSLDGDFLVVGTELDTVNGMNDAGSAYVFRWNEAAIRWDQEARLNAQTDSGDPEINDGDKFGHAVSIIQNRLVVGAYGNDAADSDAGAAYVFVRDGGNWSIEKRLSASDPSSGDHFGISVGINGSWVLVGARRDDSGGTNAGAAYLFHWNGTDWQEDEKFTAVDAAGANLGESCALGADYGIVGAFLAKSGTFTLGAAYVYAIGEGRDCNDNGKPDICDVLFGDPDAVPPVPPAEDIDPADGIPDECQCETSDQCDDQRECTDDVCDLNIHLCLFSVVDGQCLIEVEGVGVCFTDNETDPNNVCQWCDPAVSPTEWSPVPSVPAVPCLDDGNECTDDVCDSGLCTHPNLSAGTACGDATDTDCDNADTCDGAGACLPNLVANGTACPDDGNDCTDDVCDEGLCDHPDLPAGTTCGDPTNTLCNPRDTCDGAGSCQENITPDDTLCASDGLFCTGVETCQGGVCTSSGDPCAGTPGLTCDDNAEANDTCSCDNSEACDDGLGCTVDTCNPDTGLCENPVNAGTCAIAEVCYDNLAERPGFECQRCDSAVNQRNWTNKANGSACTDDGSFCTGVETCQGGLCESSGDPCASDPGLICDQNAEDNDVCSCSNDEACADAFTCTTDSCNFVTGLCENVINAGSCLIDDFCYADDAVDPTNQCQICDATADQEAWTSLPNGTACDDNLFCTGVDTCVNGACGGHTGDPCVNEGLTCNEDDNRCGCNDNADCAEDGIFCNGEEICEKTSGTCMSAGDPCSGNKPFCNETAGACLECRNANDCNDGRFCNGVETCSTSGACVAGSSPCLADEKCDEPTDRCVECKNAADCNDRDACTLDRCLDGACMNELLFWCGDDDDDGVLNGDDICPATTDGYPVNADGCACNQPGGALCDNGLYCDGLETCVNGICADGTPPCVGQGLVCNETEDRCECDEDADCDNGTFCDGAETCVNGACADGAPPCATDEFCDETGGACVECLFDADCDDLDLCTTDECLDGQCIHTVVPACEPPGNENQNDNANDNGNENESGDPLPPSGFPCALFSGPSLLLLFFGLLAMRTPRRARRKSRS